MKLNGERILFLFLVMLAFSVSGQAANVYLMITGNSVTDIAALQALQARGHTVMVGVQAQQFDGTQANLNDFDAVVILNSFNAGSGSMPRGGTSALVKYVFNGGGLVTDSWFNANIQVNGRHVGAEALLPAIVPGGNAAVSTTYRQESPDPIINDGLPETFTFGLRNVFGRTESR